MYFNVLGVIPRWAIGATKTISWNFKNFNSVIVSRTPGETGTFAVRSGDTIKKNVNTVSLSTCNPNDAPGSPGERCQVFTYFTNGIKTVDNLVASGSGSGPASSAEHVGINALNTIKTSPSSVFASTFIYSGGHYQTRLRICPTMSGGDSSLRDGENVPGAKCGYTGNYYIYDPNISDSASLGLPSGEGCVEGECVCEDDGTLEHCGNPGQSTADCPATLPCQ